MRFYEVKGSLTSDVNMSKDAKDPNQIGFCSIVSRLPKETIQIDEVQWKYQIMSSSVQTKAK